MDTTHKRVIEIMKEEGMNTNDEMLVANLCILYATAQRDCLKEQINK